MNPIVFREYDIRGLAEIDFDQEFALLLGKVHGTAIAETGGTRVTVGRDCRATSDAYAEAVIAGFVSAGLQVYDVGVCPSPLLYFSLFHLDVDGGIQITASHNPPEYNGFKICRGKDTLHGEQIQEIRRMMERGEFRQRPGGTVEHFEIVTPYHKHLLTDVPKLARPLKVVVDAGSGVGGPVAPPIFRQLGCHVWEIACVPDGNFPFHHPDPTVPENLAMLIAKVRKEKADVGIAYDGDADRIGAVDEQGNILWGDELLVLFARDMLKRNPGALVISEVKCSQRLYDDIARHGGKSVMWKAGHSLLKAKMKETGALLAGEMSGHMFFKERYFGYDDAVYASLRLLEILANSGKPLSELLADLPKSVSTPELRVDCPDDKKFIIADKATQYFRQHYDVVDVDGVRVQFPRGLGADPRFQHPTGVGAPIRSAVRRQAQRIPRADREQTQRVSSCSNTRDGGPNRHPGRARPQSQEHRSGDSARPAGRHHRCFRFRQILSRLRFALRRRPAALSRISRRRHAPAAQAIGQTRCRPHRRVVAGHRDSAKSRPRIIRAPPSARLTDIYDFLRLLFARVGQPHCVNCGCEIQAQSIEQISDRVMALPAGSRLLILAPVKFFEGSAGKSLGELARQGFTRAMVDGRTYELSGEIPDALHNANQLDLVIDRLVLRDGIEKRLADSLEVAARAGQQTIKIEILGDGAAAAPERLVFSQRFACVDCGTALGEITPSLFSFNSPDGACVGCNGTGMEIKRGKRVADQTDATPCSDCRGTRLRKESLAVRIAGQNIASLSSAAISENLLFFDQVELAPERRIVGQRIIAEITSRLGCLSELGLDYLCLDRPTMTLSGGEAAARAAGDPDRLESGGGALYSRRAKHWASSER